MIAKKIIKKTAALVLGGVILYFVCCAFHFGIGSVTCKAEYLNIGSVSKVYPVTAVMQLKEQGLVDLDSPVTEYIPDFKMADERYKKITVRMLMNHTSGLMGSNYGGSFLLDEVRSDYHEGFLKHLETQTLKADPGAFNCYCNDGFTLLEILVERVSGKSFTQYLEENICKPLSLEHTKTLWNADMEKHEPVYVRENVKIANECPQLIGAGGIQATAADVATFGSAFFTGNDVLLSEASKQEMEKNNQTGESRENFGLGWDSVGKEDYEKAGVRVFSKGGDTMFQHGSLVVAPDEKISVAVLSGGGDSGLDESVALKLMDIALSDQGIEVEHPEKEVPQLMDRIPQEYLSYEGVYADMEKTIRVSFPDERYMLVTSLTSDRDFEEQFMAARDGSFVKMDGDVASDKAIPSRPLQSVTFEEHDGQVFIADPDMGIIMYKTSDTDTDEKVQSIWEARSGVRYYCVSGLPSDVFYLIENHSLTLRTNEEARGFVNGYVIQDENHAGYETILPGTVSRDLSNLSMETIDGKEYLSMDEIGYRYISEKSIPAWTEDIKEVELKTGEAAWYKLENVKDVTLKLDIPEGASVCVYDRYENLKYSSYMNGYGDKVPLPEKGMIVFVGETGSSVGVSVNK